MAKNYYDICIVGGGASGMAAAITALTENPLCRVLILEKNEMLGRKIRATGNGRCNITNSDSPHYLKVLAFFKLIGLSIRTYPNGLVYPYSESASDVAELLSTRVEELGCEVVMGATVTGIIVKKSEASEDPSESASDGRKRYSDGGEITSGEGKLSNTFELEYEFAGKNGVKEKASVTASKVILAMGGKAGPQFGTTGDGYKIASSLGHELRKPVPALTQVECEGDQSSLSGIRARGVVRLYGKKKPGASADPQKGDIDARYATQNANIDASYDILFEEEGEIQFTHYGLSGIAVFNMTRLMRLENGASWGDFVIGLDLYPGESIEILLREKRDKAKGEGSLARASSLLRSILKEGLSAYVLDEAGISADTLIGNLTDDEISHISGSVHDLRFVPSGLHGWKDAQCTSGGVVLDEINEETSESKLVPGLYIIGEMMDYDGPCGGYNLTNAWISGIKAGKSAASI